MTTKEISLSQKVIHKKLVDDTRSVKSIVKLHRNPQKGEEVFIIFDYHNNDRRVHTSLSEEKYIRGENFLQNYKYEIDIV